MERLLKISVGLWSGLTMVKWLACWPWSIPIMVIPDHEQLTIVNYEHCQLAMVNLRPWSTMVFWSFFLFTNWTFRISDFSKSTIRNRKISVRKPLVLKLLKGRKYSKSGKILFRFFKRGWPWSIFWPVLTGLDRGQH